MIRIANLVAAAIDGHEVDAAVGADDVSEDGEPVSAAEAEGGPARDARDGAEGAGRVAEMRWEDVKSCHTLCKYVTYGF